jgi:hypothetical protein
MLGELRVRCGEANRFSRRRRASAGVEPCYEESPTGDTVGTPLSRQPEFRRRRASNSTMRASRSARWSSSQATSCSA